MANLLTNLLRRQPELTRFTTQDYINWVTSNRTLFGGLFAPPVSYSQGRPAEKVENSFTAYVSQAFKSNPVVFGCMSRRSSVFSEARFMWRELVDGIPGDLFHTDALGILEHPWPNCTTGELLTRMIQDVDLAGNCYLVNDGNRLWRLRPDWVSIVLSGNPLTDPDVEVIGYVYTPGSSEGGTNAVAYTVDQVCHWSPTPDPEALYRGMSWLTPVVREIMADAAAVQHKLNFFTNGATLGPIIKAPPGLTLQQFKDFLDAADEKHAGVRNAYRPMYLAGGSDVTLTQVSTPQMDFAALQGKAETRICVAAGVPATIVGVSEGLSGSSLNAGNYQSAKRSYVDGTLRTLWRSACAALSTIIDVPDSTELWIDERDIAFLRDDESDQAKIDQMSMATIVSGVTAGFEAESVVAAVRPDWKNTLKASGFTSVQLQPLPSKDQPPTGTAPPVQAGGQDVGAIQDQARALVALAEGILRAFPAQEDPVDPASEPDDPGDDWDDDDPGDDDPDDAETGDDEEARALVEALDEVILRARAGEDVEDEELERRDVSGELRVGAGNPGGGRFSSQIVPAIERWLREGGDPHKSPLNDFSDETIRKAAKAHGLTFPPRTPIAVVKEQLAVSVRGDVHAGHSFRRDETIRQALRDSGRTPAQLKALAARHGIDAEGVPNSKPKLIEHIIGAVNEHDRNTGRLGTPQASLLHSAGQPEPAKAVKKATPRVPSTAPTRRPTAAPFDAKDRLARLQSARSAEEARAALADLTHDQLKQVAAELRMPIRSRARTKSGLLNDLVDTGYQHQRDYEALGTAASGMFDVGDYRLHGERIPAAGSYNPAVPSPSAHVEPIRVPTPTPDLPGRRVEGSPSIGPAPKGAGGPIDTKAYVARLRAAGSKKEAFAIVSELTVPQMKELATELRMPIRSRSQKSRTNLGADLADYGYGVYAENEALGHAASGMFDVGDYRLGGQRTPASAFDVPHAPAAPSSPRVPGGGAKKLTAADVRELSPEDLARAAEEGRVSRPAAARRIRERAKAAEAEATDAAYRGNSASSGLERERQRQRYDAASARAADLKSLADSVESKPSAPRVPAKGAAPGGARPKFDPAEVAGRVASAKTEHEIIQHLSSQGYTSGQLQKVAEHLGIPVEDRPGAKSKGSLQLLIAEHEAGQRGLPSGFDAAAALATHDVATQREARRAAEVKSLAPKDRPTALAQHSARHMASALAELEQLHHDGASTTPSAGRDVSAMEHRIRVRAEQEHLPPAVEERLVQAGQSGDRATVHSTVDRLAAEHGLTRTTGRAGEVEPFDPAKHESLGAQPAKGSPVRVVSPGYDATHGGERFQARKAKVEAAGGDRSGAVSAESLKPGDYVRVQGTEGTFTGYVAGMPNPDRRGARVGLYMTENPGGWNGWRSQVTVPAGAHVEHLSPPQADRPGETINASHESLIRDVYSSLASRDDADVPLDKLRQELAARGLSDKAEQDAVLRRMMLADAHNIHSGVRFNSEERGALITPEMKAAALRVGGQDFHYITIRGAGTARRSELEHDDPTEDDITRWAAEPLDDDEIERALGHDTHPGGEEFRRYWTETPEGLAKWAESPTPWRTLYAHLVKFMNPEMAKRVTSEWFIRVFHYASGSDQNRVIHGRPPRGHRVGPG